MRKETRGLIVEEIKKKLQGRPTKYKEEFCDAIVEYFDITPTDSDGNARDPRFFSVFARTIGVTHTCLLEWARKYELFSLAYSQAKQLQEQHLVINALQNRYNASFAWRAAMNMFGWRDQQNLQIGIDEAQLNIILSALPADQQIATKQALLELSKSK